MGLLNDHRNRQLYRVMLTLCGCGLAGCSYFQSLQSKPDTDHPYPTSPPEVKSDQTSAGASTQATAAVPAAIKVPADAQELSRGDYPPPAFAVPSQPGQILVVDLDGDPTVAIASTVVNGKDSGKQMSITDVASSSSVSLNKLHRYRIVFVPK